MAAGPLISNVLDDVGPVTGSVLYGAYTNDNAPLLTVSLGDQAAAGDTLRLTDNGATVATLVLTAADLSRGAVDVQLSGLSDAWHPLQAFLAGADGAAKANSGAPFAIGVSTATPPPPTIQVATDDAGAATGPVADGGHTDDATLTFTIHEDGLPPIPTGSPGHAPYGGPALLSGVVRLYDGTNLVGQTQLGYGGDVTITTSALSAGDHLLTAVVTDRAGDVSGASSPFHVTIAPDSPGNSGAAHAGSAGQVLTAGADGGVLHGGAGDDTLTGGAGQDEIHGGEGNDLIVGGAAFDRLQGNQGADSLSGGDGDDWVVGGKDGDSLSGDQGADIVLGNQGADSCDGGAGDDTIRGGQDDDVLFGGAGADWLSGDKGNDTLTGGDGADVFHAFGGADIDRVLDFRLDQGDRVMLDADTAYTVTQEGADTVIHLGGQSEMILVNVQASSLTGGWIFGA